MYYPDDPKPTDDPENAPILSDGLSRDQRYLRDVEMPKRRAEDESPRRHFAALGTNGRDPVVWGIGRTEDEAREDAAESLREVGSYEGSADLRIVAIDAARCARIEGGEVDASDLWTCAIRSCDRLGSGHGGHPDLCGVHADAEHALGREAAS